MKAKVFVKIYLGMRDCFDCRCVGFGPEREAEGQFSLLDADDKPLSPREYVLFTVASPLVELRRQDSCIRFCCIQDRTTMDLVESQFTYGEPYPIAVRHLLYEEI